jgi:hypothetical protein
MIPAFCKKRPQTLFQQARRRRDLIDSFVDALVGRGEDVSSPVLLAQVRAAAELVVACEMCRAALLNGQPTNMHELLRLEGCASRAIRALGLRIEDRTGPPRGLERARRRWAQQQETTKQQNSKAAKSKAERREMKPHAKRERPPGHDKAQTESD